MIFISRYFSSRIFSFFLVSSYNYRFSSVILSTSYLTFITLSSFVEALDSIGTMPLYSR